MCWLYKLMSVFQITADKNKNCDHDFSYGDVVLWTGDADLAQDADGKWFDKKCRDRGTEIDAMAVDVLIDKIPCWKGEIVKIEVTIL